MQLEGLLKLACDLNVSDVHLAVNSVPVVRLNGELIFLDQFGGGGIDPVWQRCLSAEDTENLAAQVLKGNLLEKFYHDGEADLSYSIPGVGRFRINVFRQRGSVSVAVRPVKMTIPSLDELGLPETVARLARLPRGLVLVTGPTGSGKSTTLAAIIDLLNTEARLHVITLEDPIEYVHRHRACLVNQREIGQDTLSFASALRAAMREDPDIILVGEMRDRETAEIGLRAAMTGHLVLSTLHTNDAVSTANRLIDMGAPGYLVATSLDAVLAQRLVRRVCPNCAEAHRPDAHELAWLRSTMPALELPAAGFRRGAGCMQCNNSGYKGRMGVFELLEIDDTLADALRRSDTAAFHRLALGRPGYRTLAQNALELAAHGLTTLEEVVRIGGELDPTDYVPLDIATAEA